MAIGRKLKEILKQKKITVRQLAKDSGISENTLYGIIKRDNKTLDPDIAAKIVDCLQISIDELISWDEFIASTKIEFDDMMTRNKLLSSYSSLNTLGRIEAEKRVTELTQIHKYQQKY